MGHINTETNPFLQKANQDMQKITASNMAVDDLPFVEMGDVKNRNRVERRSNQRIIVEKVAFALVRFAGCKPTPIKNMSMGQIGCAMFRSNPIMMGPIKDIGMGGLSFRYIEPPEPVGGDVVLDILLADSGFYLDNIPFRFISTIFAKDGFSFDTVRVKQQGVQFMNLSGNQKHRIESFMIKCQGA
jgi:hypothetical protein